MGETLQAMSFKSEHMGETLQAMMVDTGHKGLMPGVSMLGKRWCHWTHVGTGGCHKPCQTQLGTE
jgi:hypothetical protein